MKKTHIQILVCVVIVAVVACLFPLLWANQNNPQPEQTTVTPIVTPQLSPAAKSKVLYVDSYHRGYPWSEGILNGILKVFKGKLLEDDTVDCSQSSVDLRVTRMDTKRNQSQDFKTKAGSEVKQIIDTWKPDLVIASDDNAARYVIVPFCQNTELPVVFCGINWDASGYGFPCSNVTGMVEVDIVDNMLKTMRRYALGDRIGVLGADNESNRISAENYIKQLKLPLQEQVFVKSLEDMKTAYLDLQNKVDMLILMPPSFIASDSDRADAKKFMLENTKIPTGSVETWIAPYTVFCFGKSAAEQGQWAASTALRVLQGVSTLDIPVSSNKQAELYLNMSLAKKLGFVLPVELIEQANVIAE